MYRSNWQAKRIVEEILLLIASIGLCVIGLSLSAFQPPPPDTTGNGEIEVQVQSVSGAPVAGLTVHYLDEWQFQSYGDCTTDAQGECLLTITNAPALGIMLRGVLDVGTPRYRDASLLVGERVRIPITLDASGEVQIGADILATRDPNVTPTLISPADGFATLTAMAAQPITTPSPGIELTVAAAHTAMTATTVARAGRASVTPAPSYTPTPVDGVVLVATPIASALPDSAAVTTPPVSTDSPPAAESTPVPEQSDPVSILVFLLFLLSLGVLIAVATWFVVGWYRRRQQRGGE